MQPGSRREPRGRERVLGRPHRLHPARASGVAKPHTTPWTALAVARLKAAKLTRVEFASTPFDAPNCGARAARPRDLPPFEGAGEPFALQSHRFMVPRRARCETRSSRTDRDFRQRRRRGLDCVKSLGKPQALIDGPTRIIGSSISHYERQLLIVYPDGNRRLPVAGWGRSEAAENPPKLAIPPVQRLWSSWPSSILG